MNVITLTGNNVREIELSYSPQGTAFAKGTIAVQRNFKNQDGEYETDFINFTSIGKISETIANYVKKGDKFGITGRLQIRTYEKDGSKQYFTEVIVNGFDFPSKNSTNNTPNNQSNTNTSSGNQNANNGQNGGYTRIGDDPFSGNGQIDISDDDLPF